jgi:hypothetical protein
MTIVIRHNETVKSNYLNLDIYVKKGQYVKQGTPIAAIGALMTLPAIPFIFTLPSYIKTHILILRMY